MVRDLPADALIVPTTRGQINILENHTHIVTKLDTGWLSVFGGALFAFIGLVLWVNSGTGYKEETVTKKDIWKRLVKVLEEAQRKRSN